MDKILLVLSWLIEGIARDPDTPRMLLPLKILPETQSDTLVKLTVPPEVYPDGIV